MGSRTRWLKAGVAAGIVGLGGVAYAAMPSKALPPPSQTGVIGWEKVSRSKNVPAGDSFSISAPCSTGKKVLGGGFIVDSGHTSHDELMGTTRSSPDGDTAWKVTGFNHTTSGESVFAFAICAKVS